MGSSMFFGVCILSLIFFNFFFLPGSEGNRKKKRLVIFLERTRKGHHQADEHQNCFEDSTAEPSQITWLPF